MERVTLEAGLRTGKKTKGALKGLRREDQVPAVIYGRGKENLPVTVDGRALKRSLVTEAGSNVIVNLEIKNGEKKKATRTETVMFKDIQRDFMKRDLVLHVDFIRISLTEKLSVNVPLFFTGEPQGKKEGGVVQILKREVEINCLPTSIPENFELDISSLNIGENLLIGDLELPDDVDILEDPEDALVQVLAPAKPEEELPEEDAEATEGVAGEAEEESEPEE